MTTRTMMSSYEPSFTEDTCADEADRRLLAPRACEECGAIMENGLSDVCAFCWDDEDDDLPECRDCGSELDPNGFCDECDGDPWD
jgi:predicted amidophosphoribosyltransferase